MQKDMRRLLEHKLYILLPIAFTILLTIGSLVKPVKIEDAPDHLDKFLHAGAYFGLTLLWLLWATVHRSNAKTQIGIVGILAILYGILIELFQGALTDYRTPDFMDVLANTSGVLLAWGIIYLTVVKTTLLKTKF